jgi:hypothetical protein
MKLTARFLESEINEENIGYDSYDREYPPIGITDKGN